MQKIFSKITWLHLKKISYAVLPKMSYVFVLTYVVYWSKKGGFEAEKMQVALFGLIVLTIASFLIFAFTPKLIFKFKDDIEYQKFLQDAISKRYIPINQLTQKFFAKPILDIEVEEAEFIFDPGFDLTKENIAATLGDGAAVVTFISRIVYFRENVSMSLMRNLLGFLILLGVILVNLNLFEMLGFIFFYHD